MKSIRLSLRLRLTLFVSALVVTALVALAFVSTRFVSYALIRLQPPDGNGKLQREVDDMAAAIGEQYRRNGSFAAAQTVLAKRYADLGWGGLVVSPNGELLVSVPDNYVETSFQRDGTLEVVAEIRRPSTSGDGDARRLVTRLAGPRGTITDDAGRTVAYLYLRPDPGTFPIQMARSVNLVLVGAAGLAAILAVFVTVMLSDRIVRPIERLTEMAERLGRGDTAVRAPVTRRDEIGALGASFNRMADNLERLETLRRRMLGDVAHELRTPLTNLRCQLEAMQDGLMTPSAETLASLHAELLSLSRVVDDLQDLALADAGQLRLRIETADAAALARQVAQALTSPGGPAVVVDAPAECTLRADGDRLRQILRNLVANALAVTPPGGDVHVAVTRSGDGVRIAVEDQGPGIPADKRELVFERFFRLDESRSRASGGAGLGLAVVRELVELHGGTIRVEDAAGGGAQVVVEIGSDPISAGSSS